MYLHMSHVMSANASQTHTHTWASTPRSPDKSRDHASGKVLLMLRGVQVVKLQF